MAIDWTKPIQTKDGHQARLMGSINWGEYNRAVAVTYDEIERVYEYKENGCFYADNEKYALDLINVETKVEFEWNKPFATKDGRPARLLGLIESKKYPYVVAVANPGGSEEVRRYMETGKYLEEGVTLDADLVNIVEAVKKKYSGYINVYTCLSRDGRKIGNASSVYVVKQDAENWDGSGVVIKVEWEE